MRTRYFALLFAAALLVVPASASMADTGFSCVINWAQTAGSCPGGSSAIGQGTFVLNNAQTELTYNITFSGLTGNETVAHFHNAPPGTNGGVVKNLPAGSPKVGVWRSTDATQPLTPAMVTELLAGRLYINIHSDVCPGGEIRGNIALDATPTKPNSWGKLKIMYR